VIARTTTPRNPATRVAGPWRDIGLWPRPARPSIDGGMYIHFLGSGGRTELSAGWGDETSVAALSSTRIDATAPSADDAKLTVISVLCTTTVLVAPGSRITLSGGDILGSHSLDVDPRDDGPAVHIQAIPVLGSIKIKTG
jgi:hypothetical protein